MKNRKLFIISFLVVATLVTGVGFAVINGSLNVDGDVAFFGFEVIKSDVAGALTFSNATIISSTNSNSCTASTGEQNSITGAYDSATINVNFFDETGSMDDFECVAEYKITYGTEGEPLPEVTLHAPTGDTVSVDESDTVKGVFGCTVKFKDDTHTETDGSVVLGAGEQVTIVVTVTYKKPTDGADVSNANYSRGVRVNLNYGEIAVATEEQ